MQTNNLFTPEPLKNQLKSYLAWFIATSFVFFQFFLQTATSVMSDVWVKDFHLNTIELSNLSAAFYYSYVLMQIPVGILYDRFKAKNILIVAAALLSAGCTILTLAPNYEIAVWGRVLMGFGSAFGFVGMLKIIINNFVANKFALMLGLSESISMLGVTLSVVFLAHFLTNHSWRLMMGACSMLAFMLIFAVTFLLHDKPTSTAKPKASLFEIAAQVKVLMLNKQVILGSMYAFFMFSIVNAFTSLWGVSFLTNTYPFSHPLASSMVSVVFIGIAMGGPLNGFLSKKYHKHTKIMVGGVICAFITTALIILVPNLSEGLMFGCLFLAGVFCSVYVQALAVIKDSVDSRIQATALATSNMIIMASAPLLQLLIGALLSNHSFGIASSNALNYRLALAVLPIGLFIAVVISFYIKEPVKQVHHHR